jgi:hypothetical protein
MTSSDVSEEREVFYLKMTFSWTIYVHSAIFIILSVSPGMNFYFTGNVEGAIGEPLIGDCGTEGRKKGIDRRESREWSTPTGIVMIKGREGFFLSSSFGVGSVGCR